MIELFDNGIIETSAGKVNREAFYGEFTGNKDIFDAVTEKQRRPLTKEECEILSQMINHLDLTKISKKNQKKQIAHDADQKMIWIGNKAYYFCGMISSFNDITELIEQLIKFSPIKIEQEYSS